MQRMVGKFPRRARNVRYCENTIKEQLCFVLMIYSFLLKSTFKNVKLKAS